MAEVKKLSDLLKYGLPCHVEVHGSLKQDGIASDEDEENADSIRNTLLKFEVELELQRISARVSEFQYPDEIAKLHGKEFLATRSLFVGSIIYLQYTYKGHVRKVNTKAEKSRSFPRVKKKTWSDASSFLTLAEIVDRCPLPQTVEFIDVGQQDIVLTGDAEADYNFWLILSGPIELLSVEKKKFYMGVTENCKTFILPHDESLVDSIMGETKSTTEHSGSRISNYKPDRTILDEKLFSDFDDNPRYFELGKAINSESVVDPTYRITANNKNSFTKKRSPPTFAPPPPPRIVKPGEKKSKAKQKEQASPEKSESKKKTKGGNLDAMNEYRTWSYSENVYSEPIFSDAKYLEDSTPTKVKTNDTTSRHSRNILPDPNIERKYKILNAVEEEVKTEIDTMRKVCESLDSVKVEAEIKGNIYVPMTSLKKETNITNNINKAMSSGGTENDNMCSVQIKIDSDETKKHIDENEYVEMGCLGKEVGSVNVIAPGVRRKPKTKPFKSLTKRELVKRLEECGLNDLAAVCEREKLDGQFLADFVSDQDLMHEPFSLSRYQIIKLRAAIGGWRPVTEFFSYVDSD
ncbi:hypothetical protein CHS0354_042175 [Potamilus streckersoni]|uniref:Uncharacterized protein n=1 Tax=Potamilus streckersoni TaxID=2493646 RepID=A0AAE0TQT8_9BIVA|nr:hypothetical protein CHS0354_042175 [Potamilus streckersoni]